ncbi:MAG: hypothetical protein HRT54_11135 [Colwellia sp.]|nr:hypothetical protein [Colwellia sp.]
MKLFNKTAIVASLSILGAVSSVSALAIATDNSQLQEVEIIVDGDRNKNMNVFVSVDGEITSADVSLSAMSDPDELRKLLSDVPDELREKLIESLMNAHDDNGHFKVVVDGDVDISQELHWLSEDDNEENKVIVMELDHHLEGGIAHKVIKKIMNSSHHKNVKVIHHSKMITNSLMRMIKNSDFTADELNKIQQALDAKR